MLKRIPIIGVGCMIFNSNNELLLGNRITRNANCWSCPGGHVEQGESFTQAAIRETKEECGITELFDVKQIAIIQHLLSPAIHIAGMIVAKVNSDISPTVTEPDLLLEWKWFKMKELPSNLFIPTRVCIDVWENRPPVSGWEVYKTTIYK